MSDRLPRHPEHGGRLIDAELNLLDRQILDRDGHPMLAVGDLVLERDDDGRWTIDRVILGSGLTTRFFGAHRPLATRDTLDWHVVTDVGYVLNTDAERDEVAALWRERWWRDQVISKIPGGNHDPG